MKKYNYMADLKAFNAAFTPKVNPVKLIREEFNEWQDEVDERPGTAFELKELCDLMYVAVSFAERKGWEIERNHTEVTTIIDKVKEYTEKYPHINLAATVVITAYAELLANPDLLWLYRLCQGIFAYAELKDLPFEKAWKRVHKSNMSKLGLDGKPIYREDGKVLKGQKYKQADLTDLFKEKPSEKASTESNEADSKVETLKVRTKRSTN